MHLGDVTYAVSKTLLQPNVHCYWFYFLRSRKQHAPNYTKVQVRSFQTRCAQSQMMSWVQTPIFQMSALSHDQLTGYEKL